MIFLIPVPGPAGAGVRGAGLRVGVLHQLVPPNRVTERGLQGLLSVLNSEQTNRRGRLPRWQNSILAPYAKRL